MSIESAVELIDAITPIFQTSAYILFFSVLIYIFKQDLLLLLEVVRNRLTGGASISFAGLSLGAIPVQSQLSPAEVGSTDKAILSSDAGRLDDLREMEYDRTRGYYLFHCLFPTREVGQRFTVGVFVDRHVRANSSKDEGIEIKSARFFMGGFWKNKIFDAERTEHGLGIITGAYGQFLIVCELELQSGEIIELYRYVDFRGHVATIEAQGKSLSAV